MLIRKVEPLFTAQLELSEHEIIYRPSLDIKIHNNFYDMVANRLSN